MASRYGSQALEPEITAESVITWFSLAGFEVVFDLPLLEGFSGLGLGLQASGITGMVGLAAPNSVITSLAGFGSHRPQPLGRRTAIPAAFRYALSVECVFGIRPPLAQRLPPSALPPLASAPRSSAPPCVCSSTFPSSPFFRTNHTQLCAETEEQVSRQSN